MSKEKQMIEEDINKFFDGKCGEHSCWFGFEGELKFCRQCLASYLDENRYRKMPENIGEFSDGYHTFNELYHHRAVLFSVICNMFPEKAWKSKLHDTGDMYDGMFIVGIETEQGQATYHYDIEPYWDIFKVKELEKAPKYDGHTPSDAIERIGNLPCEGYRKQSEVAKEVLLELKRQIHDKAIYPGAKDAYSFVNVKVFDAVLNNVLKKYEVDKK